MSRSKHHSKSPGYEYWSRRPLNRGGSQPGKPTKRITHRIERRIADRELQKDNE